MSERFDLDTALERLRADVKTLAPSDRDMAIRLRKMAVAVDESIEERKAEGRKCGHCGTPSRKGICAQCFIIGHRGTLCDSYCKPLATTL